MTLRSILLVAKTGIVNAVKVKECSEDDLYKRAGFKHTDGFEQRTVYPYKNKSIHVYGKVAGRAGQENKYEFPPPIAEILFFGTVVLVAKESDTPTDLTVDEWEQACEVLMGGFEDLGAEDSETATSDSANTYENDEDEDENDEDEEEDKKEPAIKPPAPPAKKAKTTKTTTTAASAASAAAAAAAAADPEVGLPELMEEEYN
jgi:hypothetical protein